MMMKCDRRAMGMMRRATDVGADEIFFGDKSTYKSSFGVWVLGTGYCIPYAASAGSSITAAGRGGFQRMNCRRKLMVVYLMSSFVHLLRAGHLVLALVTH